MSQKKEKNDRLVTLKSTGSIPSPDGDHDSIVVKLFAGDLALLDQMHIQRNNPFPLLAKLNHMLIGVLQPLEYRPHAHCMLRHCQSASGHTNFVNRVSLSLGPHSFLSLCTVLSNVADKALKKILYANYGHMI